MKTLKYLLVVCAAVFSVAALAKDCHCGKCNECKCKMVVTEETAPAQECQQECQEHCIEVTKCNPPKCHEEEVTEMRPVTTKRVVYDAPECHKERICNKVCGTNVTYGAPGCREVCKKADIGGSKEVCDYEAKHHGETKAVEHKKMTKKAPKKVAAPMPVAPAVVD